MTRALTRWLARRHPAAAVAGVVLSNTGEPSGGRFLWLDPELMVAANQAAGIRTCRVCSCTDEHGCPEGCSWADLDLCSRCAP